MTEKRGKWITVRPCDRRVKNGSRVRLAGVEGHAYLLDGGAVKTFRAGYISWMARDVDIELWVEEEVLPLPEPGIPFWGEWRDRAAPNNRYVHTGWLVVDDDGDARRLDNNYWTDADRVTRLPIPPEEMEKLK